MTVRSIGLAALLICGAVPALPAQAVCQRSSVVCTDNRQLTTDDQRASLQQALVHNGKWLAAAGVAAFSVLGASEHRSSRREWNSLLTICRSADDACAVGADGRYLRADAEALYQRSRAYDRRANRWLVGAQAALIATAALFIIDLHPGEGPENIPFPANRIEVGRTGDGVGLGLRFAF